MCHAAVRVNSISIHSLRIEGDAVQNAVVGFPHSFQSTPSVWRETGYFSMSFDGFYISIHSLRMEGDISIKNMTANYPYFNPLPPYGGRHPRMRLRRMPETFQSTPSVWRETVLQVVGQSTGHHFNPLPPYGGRHQSAQYHLHYKLFQSTPSVWRETHCCWEDSLKILHFNPLPPYGGRLCSV